MKSNIAVVILNWNGKGLLEKFLPSVIAYSEGANIYVADNASTDDSILFLEHNYPQIKIIRNDVNGGFAQGYNTALKYVKEEFLCLLNSDVEVTPGWLTPVSDIFETQQDIAVIQPKIRWYHQKEYFEYAGAAGGFIDKYGYPFCRGRIFETLETDSGQYDDETDIFWASGACFFIRNDVFTEQEGFDELFFAHMEEIDLCWRIYNSGKRIYYTSKSLVYHVGGGTLNAQSATKTFLNFRNSLFTLLKNLPETSRKKIIITRMLLDGVAFCKFMATLNVNHAFAILKAHKSYYHLKSKVLKRHNKTVKSKNYYKIPSILHSYYLRRRKSYRNLI